MHPPEMAAPTASQTIVASSVFLDLVGFSKLSTTAQVQAKDRFNATLRESLDALGSPRYWVRDLGDGALIICPHSPEHALFVALQVQQAFSALAVEPGQPALALRIGLNLGVLKTNPDLEGRPNYLGDGINATQRVMDFAQPGQVLASRAFVDAVAFLHADYAAMFVAPQSRPDKHGRMHEVFAVEPAPSTLARLYAELSAPSPSGAAAPRPPAAAHPTSAMEQALTIIRNWFIPFNALLFTVGLVWAGFQRFGFSGDAVELFGAALGCLGVAVWWLGRRKTGPFKALGGLLAALGGLVAVTGWVAPGSVQPPAHAGAAPSGAPAAASPVALPPLSRAVQPALAASAEAPATAALPPAQPVPPKVQSSTGKPRETPLPAAPRSAKLAPTAEPGTADRARCTVLLNKSALGEVISAAEKQELMQSCR
jgi:class 3 adenylate cyclase